ncbi:MAG: hypothetical protein ACP5OF_00850 [bacterium]
MSKLFYCIFRVNRGVIILEHTKNVVARTVAAQAECGDKSV